MVEMIKLYLKDGKRVILRKDSLVCYDYGHKQIKETPLEELLETKNFIHFSEDKEYGFNVNEIKHYEIYEANRSKRK